MEWRLNNYLEKNMSKKAIWITWEDHRRSRELADAFNASYHALIDSRPRLFRYLFLALRTIKLIRKEKPNTVFCQNPSIVLTTLLCMFKGIFSYYLVVDRHTNFKFNTMNSKKPVWWIFHKLSRFTVKVADLTIVTNEYLKDLVENWGGNGFVLQDRLPDLNCINKRKLEGKYNFAFICTFSDDEPYEDIVSLASDISSDIHIYITGNFKKWKNYMAGEVKIPINVHLEGFLSEENYQTLINSVDALIVLTDADYTLNCGAYEGVVLCKPLVLSNTPTIRNYFSKGATYTEYEKDKISEAIEEVVINIRQLTREVSCLKTELEKDWSERHCNLVELIEQN